MWRSLRFGGILTRRASKGQPRVQVRERRSSNGSRERRCVLTTASRAEANARNALLSTGPRTASGKARSRLNALRHGLLSRETLLPDDDSDALQDLDKRLRQSLAPQGELESLLVDRIVSAVWRLRRVYRVEAGIFTWHRVGIAGERLRRRAKTFVGEAPLAALLKRTGPDQEPPILDEGKYADAMVKVRDAEAVREMEPATSGLAFIRDAEGPDALSRLSRYETAIERSLFRALHELQRLQAVGAGHPVTPPVAVDVSISPAE